MTKPKKSFHNINIFNPNIEIKNIFEFENKKNLMEKSKINYSQDKLEYNIKFNNNKIKIKSPNKKNINFNLDSKIQLIHFILNGELNIKNKKVENIIDNFFIKFIII